MKEEPSPGTDWVVTGAVRRKISSTVPCSEKEKEIEDLAWQEKIFAGKLPKFSNTN